MSKPSPARGRATSWTQSDAARRRRGSLLVWLDPGMEWLAPPSGRPGRPETVSDAAIQDPLPPLGRRPRSAGRRHRRGVARAEGDWRVREQGPSRRRQWRRAHLALSRPTAPDGPSPPPRRRHRAWRRGPHPDPRQWPSLERGPCRRQGRARDLAGEPPLRPGLVGALGRSSRPKPGGGEDAVPQGLRGAHRLRRPRPPDCRAPRPRRPDEPLLGPRTGRGRARRLNPKEKGETQPQPQLCNNAPWPPRSPDQVHHR